MYLTMSASEMGYATGLVVLIGAGVLLLANGLMQLRATKTPQATITTQLEQFGPRSLPLLPTAMTPAVPPVNAGGDDFFGGSVRGQAATPVPGMNPAVTDSRWHADFSDHGTVRTQATKSTSNTGAIIMVVLGVGLAAAGLVQGYLLFFAPGRTIEVPDQLLGMERINPDSAIGKQLETGWQQIPSLPNGEELITAGYSSGQRLLFVAGAETAPTNSADTDDSFAGFEAGMSSAGPEFGFSDVDPGPLGGEMRCGETNPQGVGACAWVDEDTVGFVVVAAPGLDVADTAREVRESVEH